MNKPLAELIERIKTTPKEKQNDFLWHFIGGLGYYAKEKRKLSDADVKSALKNAADYSSKYPTQFT